MSDTPEELTKTIVELKQEIVGWKQIVSEIQDRKTLLDEFALAVAGKFEGRWDYTAPEHAVEYARQTYVLAGALLKRSRELKEGKPNG